MSNKKRCSFIDLFAGAGGLSLGFKKSGCKHILGIEFDPRMAETYRRNIGPVLVKDIRKVHGSNLPKVTLIIGGPPCQGFSSANFKNWNQGITNDPRNNLIFEFARIVEEKKPKAFLMENAPTLMSSRFKSFLQKFERKLPNYDIECRIVALGDLAGLPQKRRRTICIGKRKA